MKNSLLIFFVLLFSVGYSQWQALPYITTGGDCDEITGGGELFISEINDSPSGSYGAIEIYNPTNTTINLSNYSVRRSGDYGSGAWTWETGQAGYPNLSGNLPPGGIYLIMVGTNGNVCNNVTYNLSLGQNAGINANDQIQLRRNGITIDDVGLPNHAGYSLIRRPDAETPKAIFDNADWTTTGQNCAGLGNHTIDNVTAPEIDNISRYRDNPGQLPYTYCQTPARVRVQMNSIGSGYTYSYNLQGTATPVNMTNTTGIFSNLQEDTYILTVTVRRNTIVLCTIEVEFVITGGTQTSPIILLNP